jgi:putative DNA primase/helicase
MTDLLGEIVEENKEKVERDRTPEEKEAKFHSDKRILEMNPSITKRQAEVQAGVNPENYDKINREKIEEEERRELRIQFLTHIKFKEISQASELLVEYVLKNRKIYTTKDDNKSEMWVYKGGIYTPNGRSEVKELLRNVLKDVFSMWYFNQAIAKIEADTFVEPEKFFRLNYPNEVPVQNGILNTNTRKLTSFNPKKIFFNKLPVKYDPEAKCEMIDDFLSDILSNEEDKKIYYEIGGFALLKEYRFEKAFMFVGDGRNGKGKSLELMKRTIGTENCCSIPLGSLKSDSFSISELFGKMINLAGDISNTDLKDTGMFKSLTGRDLVTSKRKFLKDLPFENYAKFVFACNDLPMVYDLSKGFWDRWVLLEFPFYFADKEKYNQTPEEKRSKWKIRDENIISKITTEQELSGLLNMFLEGLDRLKKNHKFSSTIGSEEIKDIWIRKANSFIAFCMDKLEECADSKITKKEIRRKYSSYCKKYKVSGKSDVVIKIVLQEMFGVIDEKTTFAFGNYPEWCWVGIKWK